MGVTDCSIPVETDVSMDDTPTAEGPVSLCYDFSPFDSFLNGGFSLITVSSVKEKLFEVYYKAQVDKEKLTDFKIAQDLGIRPSQARNLRYRYDQTHTEEMSDEERLKAIILGNPIACTPDGRWIQIYIRDLYSAEWLKNYLLSNKGACAELSLSGDSLRMSVAQLVVFLEEWCREDTNLKQAVEQKIEAILADDSEMEKAFKSLQGKSFLSKMLDPEFLRQVMEKGGFVFEFAEKLFPAISGINWGNG